VGGEKKKNCAQGKPPVEAGGVRSALPEHSEQPEKKVGHGWKPRKKPRKKKIGTTPKEDGFVLPSLRKNGGQNRETGNNLKREGCTKGGVFREKGRKTAA